MEINKLIKNVCGSLIYIQTLLLMLLNFAVAVARFLATRHLGLIIDAVGKGQTETIYHFAAIAVSLLLYLPGSGAASFFEGKMMAGFAYSMRTQAGAKICSAQYRAIEQINDGELLVMISKDIDSLKNWIGLVIKFGILPVCLGVAPIALFQWCNWKFALFALCLIPLNAVPSVLFSKKLSPFHDKEKSAYAKVLSHFTDSLHFDMLIKAFQLEGLFQDRHREALDNHRNMRKKRLWIERLAEEYNRSFGHMSSILLLLFSAYFIYRGELTLGRLTGIILLADFVGEGLKILGSIPISLPAAKVGAGRIGKLYMLQEDAWDGSLQSMDIQDGIHGPNARFGNSFPADVPVYEARGLSFSYGNTVVLRDLVFRVRQGEKIAVVGFSGSGKSTLFKLLSGLYSPEEGQIYFRGTDIARLSSAYLRRQVTVTTQEAFLFHAAFRDNIMMAGRERGEAELADACKNAQLDSYLQMLSKGYDTEINTTVQSVSNGQMQRINLARAFLRDGEVFLLDEPVSALDSVTAGAIWEFLFSDCRDKTLLVILHDLEEVWRFDKVLFLAQGRAASFGTHNELLQNCGLYKKLYQEKTTNTGKGV